MDDTKTTKIGALVRMGVFLFLGIVSQILFFWLFQPLGVLIAAALGTFAAAGVTTALTLRMFERSSLSSIGLRWHPAALRHVGLGMAIGIGSALLVTILPFLMRIAEFVPKADTPFNVPSLIFVSLLLLFGVMGEEILFRGYGFQILAGTFGRYQVLLPVAVLFAAAHAANANSSPLALLNTFLWGVALGYAFLRSGDLWLPIGVHFGWNVTLPLVGVELSGFTMGLTGYSLHWKIGDLWSGGAYGPEGGLVTSLVIPVVFFALYRAQVVTQKPYLMRFEEEE